MKLLIPSLLIASVAFAQVTPAPLKPASGGSNPMAPVRPNTTPAPVQPGQGGLPTAAEQRLSYAQQAFGLAHSMYRQGNISADAAATWSLRIYEAQKDSPTAAKEHLDRMIALEKLAIERVQGGSAPVLDKMTVAFFRAHAEQLAGKK
ncbi:MAG: hypothetical protein Q8L48_26515 [Archangium sp.]|nr:hypothetical protein [Archangium sp.]